MFLKWERNFHEILNINRRVDFHVVTEIVHGEGDCNCALYGYTSVYSRLMRQKIQQLDGTPWRWRRRAPKRVGVLVKQCNLVYEKWYVKHWFD